MKFPVLSDEELRQQRGTLKVGPANFEVTKAIDTTAKSSGAEMTKLTLKVWDSEGKEGVVFDNLVASAAWKIKQFFDSIGSPESYLKGDMNPDMLVGSSGKCELVLQSDKTGQYGDQIKIKSYLKSDNSEIVNTAKKVFSDADDMDINF